MQLPASAFKRILPAILFAVVVVFIACNKERDEKHPEIVIYEPEDGAIVRSNVMDVVFRASDDQYLSYVRLALTNSYNNPISVPVFFYPRGRDTTITYRFTPENGLRGGNYYIQVMAEDGHNSKFKYHEVKVTFETTVKAEAVYVSQRNQGWEIWRVFANGQHEQIFGQTQPISHILSGGYNQMFYTLASSPSKLQARASATGSVMWQKEAGVPPSFFSDMYVDGNSLLLADAGGKLLMLNAATGTTQNVHYQQMDTIPESVFFDDKFAYVSNRLLSGGSYVLNLHHRATLKQYRRYQMSGKVWGIFSKGKDEVVLAVEDMQGTLNILSFHKQTEVFIQRGVVSGHQMRTMKDFSEDEMLFVSDKGLGFIRKENGQLRMVDQRNDLIEATLNPRNGHVLYTNGSSIYSSPGTSTNAYGDVKLIEVVYSE